MRSGRVIYSIKYDLGGAVGHEAMQSGKLRQALSEIFPGFRENDDDLAVFNFSYLSRSTPTYLLDTSSIEGKDGTWEQEIVLDASGVVTIWLSGPPVQAESAEALALSLLGQHDLFLEDKNRDYLIYLDEMKELRGRLASRTAPESSGKLEFRTPIGQLRQAVRRFVGRRVRYNFHDFRPVFILDEETFASSKAQCILLTLSGSQQLDADPETDIPSAALTNRYTGNTWSYTVKDSAWTPELRRMFSHAHSNWFQIHGSIFEMKDIEDLMNRRLNSELSAANEEVGEFIRYLEHRKNIMFSEMFSALNSDFITKNAQCKDDLDIFMHQFGVNRQISILKEYTERITAYLREYNDHMSLLQARALSRNTRVLELLFLLNTIAGIAGFAPALFDTDLGDQLVLDTPRLAALGIIAGSLLFYLFVIVFGRIFSRRKKSNLLQDELVNKLDAA